MAAERPAFIEFYLKKLRRGEKDDAFHGLIDLGREIIPHLQEIFRQESSPTVRAELVRIIWEYRRTETAAFLCEALNDPDSMVWKSALDGLVTLASPEALQVFQKAADRELLDKKKTEEFRRWVEGAVSQILG